MDDAQAQAESEQKHVDSGADACSVWSEELQLREERRGEAGRGDAHPQTHNPPAAASPAAQIYCIWQAVSGFARIHMQINCYAQLHA